MAPVHDILGKLRNSPAWLGERTIFLCRHGSHAYGTQLDTSDEDFRGVAIPPDDQLHGFLHRFEQFVGKEVDVTVFSIQKFFKLACDCNPNVVEILFTDPADHLHITPLGSRLREIKNDFLSKKARHTFSGYAMSQLKRINTHHRWLLEPPDHKPLRAEFQLPETTVIPKDQLGAAQDAITKKMESWKLGLDDIEEADKINIKNRIANYLAEIDIGRNYEWELAARSIGYDENFLELLHRERRYRHAKADWDKYQNWLKSRNPQRAELEARFGYDTKHAMHLVRLLRMCEEILKGDGVIVRRPDAEELLQIRNGAWSYERLIAWAEEQDSKIETLYASSSLPRQPDKNKLNTICIEIVQESFGSVDNS